MGIRIREKKLKSGKKSLYLDIHHNSERSYEFLKIYLTGNTQKDNEAKRKAEIIKGKFLERIQNDEYGLEPKESKQESFYAFFQPIIDKHLDKGVRNYENVKSQLEAYHGKKDLRFKDITTKFVWGFRDHLLEKYEKQNTPANYFAIFKGVLTKAVKRGKIRTNPGASVDDIPFKDTVRDYLEEDELNKLAATPCEVKDLKRAFLFACFTGLRISDIKGLQWKHVRSDKIDFGQKKTTKVNYVPLNNQANKLLGKHGKPKDYVFNIPTNRHPAIKKWGKDAGLSKHLHFHMSRHTFGTRLGVNGANVQTIANMLGVTLSTAQVYAKITDEMKKKASDSLPEIKDLQL